jgi:hypothetical protein
VDRQSALGNPFTEQRYGRNAAIAHYQDWLAQRLSASAPSDAKTLFNALQARVRAGEKIALQCWCAPKACHADVIRERLMESAS